MRWLTALMSGLGLVVGLGLAVATHHASSRASGWTGYAALSQRRYADYLPKRGASWLPALLAYPVAGAFAGLAVGLLLAGFGFRLTRRSSGSNTSAA